MKKLIILSGKIVILGLIITLNSCNHNRKQNSEVDQLLEQIKELKQTITNLEDCVIPPLEKPLDKVALSVELKDFSQYYYDFFKMRRTMQNLQKPDALPLKELKQLFITEGIWFDYTEFKEYIAFIDKNAKEAKIEISGLRFFPVISKETRKMALVYNPTIKSGDGNFSYALQKEDESIKPVLLKDIIKNYVKIDIPRKLQKGSMFSFLNSATTNDNIQSQAGNRGQVNPPPADVLDQNDF